MADAFTLISNVVELLAPFLLDKLKKEVKMVLGAPKDVQELFDTFDMIKYVLVDAEKRHIHKVLYNMEKGETGKAPESAWLEKLKEVSYQMEDVLDEWHTKLMKLEIDEGSDGKKKVQTTGKSKNKVWACFTSPCSYIKKGVLHHKIGSRILELKKQLDKLENEKNTFKFEETRGDVERQIRLVEDKRDEGSKIDLSKVCGRDLEKTNLINMLLSKSSNAEENIPVISIIGMGGIGKTTLAKCIFNDEMVKNQFQKQMWVCVSDPFDFKKIAKEIIKRVGGEIPNGTDSWEDLCNLLCQSIEGKKFLLVLDDVWTKDRAIWEKLKLALDFGKNGSIIIVTTRDESVADFVGTIASDKHMIRRLSDEDCWWLFERFAFKGIEEFDCQRLKGIGRDISDKCKGVPLHAMLLGSLLGSPMRSMKTKEEEWKKVLRSDIWDLPLVSIGVLPALLLSYNALPSQLKRCFTYCAVFAKDTEIKKDTLIKMWMAEGCLGSTKTSELEKIGETNFNDLVMRSFFQEMELDEYGDVDSCKMHDLLHDLATFLGNKECQVEWKGIELNNTKLRHLHVQSSHEEMDGSLNSIWRLKSLRTLLAGESSLEDWAQMSNLRCLRTLDLSWASITKLSKEVEKLIHLRYLNLSFCEELKELPETITNLCNLQTLDLRVCSSLGGLPNSFGKLIHLRYLNLSRTDIKELPETITNLLNLQTLDLGWCSSLGGLPNSLGKLDSLRYLNLSWTKIKELPETITDLINLQSLDLSWCSSLGGLPNSFGKLVSLRHLDIDMCYEFKGLPRGIGKLRELRTLSNFIVSEEGCNLGELKDLNNLHGSLTIRKIRGIGDEAEGVMNNKKYLHRLELSFSSESEDDDLKALELLKPHSDLKELGIMDYSGLKFPSWIEFLGTRQRPIMLRRLEIRYCSNLKVLPALEELQFLKYLKLEDLKSVATMGLEVLGDAVGVSDKMSAFPKLKELEIWNMKKWEEWVIDKPSMNITLMPCLQFLYLRNCPVLKSLPWQLLSSSSLRKLVIDDCPNLVVSRLPFSLEELTLWGDAGSLSKSLPVESGLHTNLKYLKFKQSKQLTLPEGVSQFTALQTLSIISSPIMAARCKKEEGEDWNIISYIPNIDIRR